MHMYSPLVPYVIGGGVSPILLEVLKLECAQFLERAFFFYLIRHIYVYVCVDIACCDQSSNLLHTSLIMEKSISLSLLDTS